MNGVNEAFKPLAAMSIIVGWTGLIFMVRMWPGNKSMPFSNHAAQFKAANIFYGALFTLILPPLFLFFAKWFVPTFSLPAIFTVLTLVAITGQIVAGWVPTTDGIKAKIHRIAALTMHTLLLPLNLMIVAFANISTVARVIAIITSVVMMIIWYLFGFVKATKRHLLHVQAAYVVMFHITILSATYIR